MSLRRVRISRGSLRDRRASGLLAGERRITYKDVFTANRVFEDSTQAYDSDWVEAKKFVKWAELSTLPRSVVMQDVVGFLNRWKSRLPKTFELVDAVQGAHRDVLSDLKALEGLTLWDYDPAELVLVGGQQVEAHVVIFEVFQRFTGIGHRARETAASKLLHMLNPSLFIMWDTAIADAYGVSKTPDGYVYEFMPLMKEKANQVIASYREDFQTTRDETVARLNAYRPYKTLTKLLDEYNWIQYTFGD